MTKEKNLRQEKNLGAGAYIALVLIILFFSGVMKDLNSPLKFFDFTTLSGAFGKIGETEANFQGVDGDGAKGGFLFAVSLIPNVMLALGSVAVAEYFGAIRAAQKLLTPLLKPLLGIPGSAGLALISSMQSTDAGATMTKDLKDKGFLNQAQVDIFSAWQYSSAGMIGNFFGTCAALWALENADGQGAITISMMQVFLLIFIMKFVGANLVRLVFYRKQEKTEDVQKAEETELCEEDLPKKNPVTTFVDGARNGFNIGVKSILPNVVMAFVLIKILNVSGVMDFLGQVLAPVMGVFGLPGEAITVLLASCLSTGGGVGVAGSLFNSGVLTGIHLAILAPAIMCLGSIVQYMGRLLAVTEANHKGFLFLTAIINGLISMLIMNVIL